MNKYRLIIYTCVIGHYDIVFPPIIKSDNIDYIILTDSPKLRARGWEALLVDVSMFDSNSSANRYFKIFPNRVFKDYTHSLYVDGNIRLIGDIALLFKEFFESASPIGLFRHPYRTSVQEEIEACVKLNKITNKANIAKEYHSYVSDGFKDQLSITENNMIFRDHSSQELDAAMTLWWQVLKKGSGRDQISLPYVRWKTGIRTKIFNWNSRVDNDFVKIYPHFKGERKRYLSVYLSARQYDSFLWLLVFRVYKVPLAIRKIMMGYLQ